MPTAPVVCPSCNAHLFVDVNQRIGTLSSDSYEEGDEGVAITQCEKCNSLLKVDWIHHTHVKPSYFCYGRPSVLDEEHTKDLTEQGVPVVFSVESDNEKEFYECTLIARQTA